MDTYIKQGIEARYNAYFNAYNIEDQEIKNKIDDLFKRINELGETAKDYGDFEAKLVSSPLNSEYITLFTEVAMKCSPKEQESAPVYDENKVQKERAKHETKRILEDATRPIRRRVRWKMQDTMRDTPLGTVEQLINIKGLFDKNKK